MSAKKKINFQIQKDLAKKDIFLKELKEIHELGLNASDVKTKNAFLTRLPFLDALVQKIIDLNDNLNDLNFQINDNFTPNYDVLKEIEVLKFEILELGGALSQPNRSSNASLIKTEFKLPKISLPEFSGILAEWPLFYEKFRTIIHENPNLDNTAKLHYLLSALKGRASEVCAGITPNPSNYEVLLNTLLAKYNNKRALADTYFRQMTDLKPLSQESATALSQTVLQFDAAYKSLQQLDIPDLADFFSGALILSKLDPQTRREFETSNHNQIPTYSEIVKFLYKQIEALNHLPKSRINNNNKISQHNPFSQSNSASQHFTKSHKVFVTRPQPKNQQNFTKFNSSISCSICQNSHHPFQCKSFIELDIPERIKLVKEKNLCCNCLSSKHNVTSCRSTHTCRFCQQLHHSLLHINKVASTEGDALKSQNFCAVSQINSSQKVTLLSTAVVLICTPSGYKPARFLIDTASQSHFITAQCCRKLNLPIKRQRITVEGIGSVAHPAVGQTKFAITSRYDSQIKFNISALVVDKITEQLPALPICTEELGYLKNLPLADDKFFQPGPVEGILGADIFIKIIDAAKVTGPSHLPVALETKLGYILMGQATLDLSTSSSESVKMTSTQVFCSFSDLNTALQKFWSLEEVPSFSSPTDEELTCEELFQKTTTRDRDGRYCVHLPFKEFPPALGDSRTTAEKRFLSLERQFKKSPTFQSQYAAVINDYLKQGHMSQIDNTKINGFTTHYIPHFAIIKDSSSTPLRIVFDASVKTSNSRSLNNTLFKGPKLHNDITQILTAFRISAFAIIADIRQMYRNITMTPEHRSFQRIFWRESPAEPLQTLELNCVVFGLTSAPYLALRTVQQLAIDEKDTFPLASNLVKEGMYVDDVVISLDSIPEVIKSYHELVGLFRAGGFCLTKWLTNSSELLNIIPQEDRVKSDKIFSDSSDPQTAVKVLGLRWDAETDTFLFKVQTPNFIFTKRGILSTVARIWDPLGFLSPVTLYAKCLIKELWISNIDWDEEIPSILHTHWETFLTELSALSDFRVPRHFGTYNGCKISLIGFADSSEKGYGAIVYCRTLNDTTPKITLLCAKSKVAPAKVCSLPRLELCAALLLAKLLEFCRNTLIPKLQIESTFAFTDSTVTLAWIKNSPHRWKTFIANRVAKIQNLTTPEEWFHVRSSQNIADVISRGLTPVQLVQHTDWLQGPSWLKEPIESWPIQSQPTALPPDDLLEKKQITIACITTLPADEWPERFIQRFSSWRRLLHVTVYILRFAKRLPRNRFISATDLSLAEHILIRQIQRIYFHEEFDLLQKSQFNSSKLKALSPFIDNEILRVGGRLLNSNLAFSMKHPILLPNASHISTLIIEHYHRSHLHTGPNLVLSLIRQKYWILSARNLVRKLIKNCNWCFRLKPRTTYPQMADLPAVRVQEAKPFVHSGVDYAGPFQISISRRRGVRTQKAYLCLFVCLVTKAVHLELASSLSTEAFLDSLIRFISRRGPISCLYSDRGTNFIGAKTKLNEIYTLLNSQKYQNEINTFLTSREILWKFNPPAAPHFGGLWEANVRSVKTHLVKAIGTQILSYEEFYTVLTQVEAILNSRPLCPLSSDPAEPEALTPSHFLTLTPLTALPLNPEISGKNSLKSRKELLDSIINTFWKRWSLEYLTTLHPRKKWQNQEKPLAVGTTVLMRHENLPPLRWPLGVIEEVFPGADGVVRVATIRTKSGVYTRPVVKLYPLPTQ